MLWILSLSYPTWVLLGSLSAFLVVIFTDRKSNKQGKAPGPYALPLLGSVLSVAKYPDTSLAFSALAKQYGDIFYLRLGSLNCMVISGMEKIRTVLHTKGHLFDSRPDFTRFNLLFGNDRNNSVAFSNWSDLQRKRRDLIKNHTFPKQYSSIFEHLDSVAGYHVENLMSTLAETSETSPVYLKTMLRETLGKIFVQYFTSTEITEENNEDFTHMIEAFDFIFQEVNEGCIGDIIPSLMFLCNKSHLPAVSEKIRHFVVKHCVEPRVAQRLIDSEKTGKAELKPNRHSVADMSSQEFLKENEKKGLPHPQSVPNFSKLDFNNNMDLDKSDLLDTFLNNVGKDEVTLDVALFALEDILGGHSAIANMLTRLFVLLAHNEDCQEKIRAEVFESVGGSTPVTLFQRLPYTEATMWEGVRHISSPIVPHVAVEDTTIDDVAVAKGTVIFLNNRDLHFSPKYWEDPEKFAPERFLTSDNTVQKPENFIPFSTGRRSCMGYKMVQYLTFLILANVCQKFRIQLDPTENYTLKGGNLAVSGQGFRFILKQLD